MKFKIVEQETVSYEDFKKDYLACELTREEIREKYSMGVKRYNNWANDVTKETGLIRTPQLRLKKVSKEENERKEPKYYYYNTTSRAYLIIKNINGIVRYFATCHTEQEAIETVELLKQNNWNKECLI